MDPASAERPSAFPWPPLLFIAAIGAALMLGRLAPLPWPGLGDLPARIVGYGFGLAGLVLMAWAVVTMLRAGTNLAPHRAADRLVTTGPFRIWRHPIYMGDALIVLGLAEVTGNIWFAIMAPVFAIAVYALAIVPEERHLEARFGEEYLAYKGRTRRWF
jgi:protein-S-isoprenylcysteine O-methyltransferase Ste14